MIICIVTLIYLIDKLRTCHIKTCKIIMKSFISSGCGLACYFNSFRHIYIFPFYK
nr:MAG TPA: hypothetical protein [Caudoviricetes sp.]